MDLYTSLRPLLFRLDAETAHHLGLSGLALAHKLGLSRLLAPPAVHKPVQHMGLYFDNPLGLAAGLDKNGDYIDALAALGFGFIELGTVTPRPQPGNPKPRLFRLPEAGALINRMGFNNKGVEHLVARVRRARYRGVLGVNIGKNFDTPNDRAIDDYLFCLRKTFSLASYIVVNISSPNTKGLRDLQHDQELEKLVRALVQARQDEAEKLGRSVPLLVKIAPDLDAGALYSMVDIFLRHGIDGVIATNTTLSRDGVAHLPAGGEQGGLSGEPLRERAVSVLRLLRERAGSELTIIAAGGISSAADASERLAAGADLLQIYTGLIYKGPHLIADILSELSS